MNVFLEELWETYQNAHPDRNDDEEKALVKELCAHEEALLKQLNEEGAKQLHDIENILNAIGSQNEKKAFAAGIRFAVKFMHDSFYE